MVLVFRRLEIVCIECVFCCHDQTGYYCLVYPSFVACHFYFIYI